MRWATAGDPDSGLLEKAAAGSLLALGLIELVFGPPSSEPWAQAFLTVAWTVPLVWRRRWPVPVLAVVVVAGVFVDLVNETGGSISYVLAGILASFTVGRHLDPPLTWWGPALCVGVSWFFYALSAGVLSDYFFTALIYGGAWAVGYALRRRAASISDLASEADELRRRQAERERQATAAERARIARELHDIVSHSISVIAIQAQAVRRRLGREHPAEIDDLRTIEETARQAMAEMRMLLGVLRADGDPVSLAPQPGLDQLPRLLAETRAAGVAVELRIEGEPGPLPPGVDLAAYRVVQEALTNCRKHAPGATVAVVVRYDDETIELCIDDDGGGVRGDADAGGHGLIGMRERISLYGGTLRAGPRAERGFSVHATLPRRQQISR